MYPARLSRMWLGDSASAGASRVVGVSVRDQRWIEPRRDLEEPLSMGCMVAAAGKTPSSAQPLGLFRSRDRDGPRRAQLERIMHHPQRPLAIVLREQARDADLAGRDI